MHGRTPGSSSGPLGSESLPQLPPLSHILPLCHDTVMRLTKPYVPSHGDGGMELDNFTTLETQSRGFVLETLGFYQEYQELVKRLPDQG